MNIKNKIGFTLMEIVVVIIIIGVLASLSMPRMFRVVEFSRSTEALNAMISLRNSIERCYLPARTYINCDFNNIDMENPQSSPGSHFTYGIADQTVSGYTITATRNTVDNGDNSSQISIMQQLTGATRFGTGAFVGIR